MPFLPRAGTSAGPTRQAAPLRPLLETGGAWLTPGGLDKEPPICFNGGIHPRRAGADRKAKAMEYQTSRTSYEVQTESYGEWVTAAVADNLADARKSFHKIAWPGQTVRIVRLTTLVTEQELYYLAGVSS